jgi:hypothetical protein
MLVLKDGKIAWKYLGRQYRLHALDLALGGKSVVSALVGVAIKEGKFTRSTTWSRGMNPT